jgi:hypothetical protein
MDQVKVLNACGAAEGYLSVVVRNVIRGMGLRPILGNDLSSEQWAWDLVLGIVGQA